ncbi:MAG: hypothetical protein PHW76_04885 [Alphaproteobacteria bacterium]|nr:hypothetical protein [Alphaproteobacteria bacterium]
MDFLTLTNMVADTSIGGARVVRELDALIHRQGKRRAFFKAR